MMWARYPVRRQQVQQSVSGGAGAGAMDDVVVVAPTGASTSTGTGAPPTAGSGAAGSAGTIGGAAINTGMQLVEGAAAIHRGPGRAGPGLPSGPAQGRQQWQLQRQLLQQERDQQQEQQQQGQEQEQQQQQRRPPQQYRASTSKLTPPPQLHERVLLKGQHYRQSQQLQGTGSNSSRPHPHTHPHPHPHPNPHPNPQHQQNHHQSMQVLSSSLQKTTTSHFSQPPPQPQLQQHLNAQRDGSSSSSNSGFDSITSSSSGSSNSRQGSQRLRLHLGGGSDHKQQQRVQSQVPPPRKNNFPYANSNRDTTSLSSTSTRHHHNYWPDDFRNPRGGLAIEHNLPSPPNTKYDNVRRGVTPSKDDEVDTKDTVNALLPPPSLARNDRDTGAWRPASSIYSEKRDSSYVSPVSPNFANVAARTAYSSVVADISPPSSPDMEVRRHDGTPADDGNVSPIEDSPDLSHLSVEDRQRSGQQSPNHQQKSNIPMMRRERRKNQDAAAAASHHTLRETKSQQRLRIQRETKWDDMTGEPTYLDTGRAGQVRPQEYAQEFGTQPFGKSPAALRAMQNAPQTQQTFGDRLRRLRPIGAGSKAQQQQKEQEQEREQQQQRQLQQQQQQQALSATAPGAIDDRPPWHGASGRAPIVNPVRDTAPKEPLSIPRRSSRRTAVGPRLPIAGVTSPLSPVSPSRSETSSPRSKTPTARTVLNAPRQLMASPSPSPSPTPSPSAARTPLSQQPAQSSYPSPPNSGAGIQSPVHATPEAASSASVATRQSPSLSGLPVAPNANLGHDKAIRRKPPPANSQALHAPQPSYSSSVYSDATVHAPAAHDRSPPRASVPPKGEALKANEPWDQPHSRFSVTTYATSAAPDTPRVSVETTRPPVPALPTNQQDGVMNRKRPPVLGRSSPSTEPIVISMSSPYMSSAFAERTSPSPSRSQLPSQLQPMPRASTPSMYSTTNRPESVWSTSKALPPPPTESSMVNDRVGYLNARLESLGNRRININQAIKQMTELMPTDSILASEAVLRKREAEKRKVEALKVELAEVQREEYEIGLKLHRAYKRMDRNAEYEPTSLWVRRVTG